MLILGENLIAQESIDFPQNFYLMLKRSSFVENFICYFFVITILKKDNNEKNLWQLVINHTINDFPKFHYYPS